MFLFSLSFGKDIYDDSYYFQAYFIFFERLFQPIYPPNSSRAFRKYTSSAFTILSSSFSFFAIYRNFIPILQYASAKYSPLIDTPCNLHVITTCWYNFSNYSILFSLRAHSARSISQITILSFSCLALKIPWISVRNCLAFWDLFCLRESWAMSSLMLATRESPWPI